MSGRVVIEDNHFHTPMYAIKIGSGGFKLNGNVDMDKFTQANSAGPKAEPEVDNHV